MVGVSVRENNPRALARELSPAQPHNQAKTCLLNMYQPRQMNFTNITAFFIESPMFNMNYISIQKVQMQADTIRYVIVQFCVCTESYSRRKIHTIIYTWNSSDKEYFAMSELKIQFSTVRYERKRSFVKYLRDFDLLSFFVQTKYI